MYDECYVITKNNFKTELKLEMKCVATTTEFVNCAHFQEHFCHRDTEVFI